MGRAAKTDKGDSFEDNLGRLDAVVHELDDADLPLERALQLYEEGMKISAVCQQQLQEAEGRVEILLKKVGQAGERTREPFEPEETPPR